MTAAREVLTETLDDLREAEVPDDLRVIAFSKVFDLRVGNITPSIPGGAAEATPESQIPTGADEPLGAIAERIGATRDLVAEVFDVRDGQVELIFAAGKLPAGVAAATKEIALLLAGGRQAAHIDEWTSTDLIRAMCGEFKRLDAGNFAKTIKTMEDVFNFRRESERKTSVKLARPGWESFAASVRRIGGQA